MDRGDSSSSSSHRGRCSTVGAFYLRQLYEMVDDPSTDSIASWSKSGKSFIVWNDCEFGKSFCPRKGLKFLGCRRVDESEDWEYASDYFVRGQPELKPLDDKDGGRLVTPELSRELEPYEKRKHSRVDSHGDSWVPLPRELHEMRDSFPFPSRPLESYDGPSRPRRGGSLRRLLYDLVDDPSTDSIVSWSESGKSFIIWNEAEFLPRTILYKDMTYFTRGIELMGFRKVESEHLEHECDYFARGQPEITRPVSSAGLMISPELHQRIERGLAH